MLETAKLRDWFCLGRPEAAYWFLAEASFDHAAPLSTTSKSTMLQHETFWSSRMHRRLLLRRSSPTGYLVSQSDSMGIFMPFKSSLWSELLSGQPIGAYLSLGDVCPYPVKQK
jgi:hypothetical protein